MASSSQQWHVGLKPSDKHQTPTFTRLFIINRVLQCYTSDDNAIRSLLVSVFDNAKEEEVAFSVLSKLVKHGIKTYVNDYCNYIETSTHIIDQIFNKSILTKFNQEYARITTYNYNYVVKGSDHDKTKYKQKYESMVFNTKDLMCLIFQFVQSHIDTCLSDFYNCSLVCSHWLYHSFNPNSFYHIQLDRLFCSKGLTMDNPRNTRLWQRVANAKTVSLGLSWFGISVQTLNDFTLSKILMMTNIEKVHLISRPVANTTRILQAIMHRCNDCIKEFNVEFCYSCDVRIEKQQFVPLKLLNAEKIHMYNLYFYIIWSNKCQQLYLHGMQSQIDDEWINFVIDNCDCSGIKFLDLYQLEIRIKHISDKNQSILFSKLIKKFINLDRVNITLFEDGYNYFVTFWKCLNVLVCKNDTFVSLYLDFFAEQNYQELTDIVQKNKIRVSEIHLDLSPCDAKMQCDLIVTMNHLQYLYICGWQWKDGIEPLKKFVNHWHTLLSAQTIPIEKTSDHDHEATVTKQLQGSHEFGMDIIANVATENGQQHLEDFLIGCSCNFMPRLKVIAINSALLESEMSIVNEIIPQLIEIVDQLDTKHQVLISAKFYMCQFSYDNVIKYTSLFTAFKKFCQIALDVLKQEFETVIPIEIELEIPNTKKFITDAMKRIFLTFGEKETVLTKYKQPKSNKYCIPSETPIFHTKMKNGTKNVVFQCGNCCMRQLN